MNIHSLSCHNLSLSKFMFTSNAHIDYNPWITSAVFLVKTLSCETTFLVALMASVGLHAFCI